MSSTSKIRVFIGEPSSIDPAHGFEHDGALILRFLADPLVDFDPNTGEPRPAAASRWELSSDGLTVRFWLRPDVRFHHGRTVTAEDYVYSLSRVVQPATRSKLAYNLACIEGFDDVRAGRTELLTGLQAINPHLLEVRLAYPYHEVPNLFGHRVTAAVPQELADGDPDRFRLHPVSTGPYQISQDWAPGVGVTLEQCAGYYRQNMAFADGGPGYLQQLQFRIYDELESAYHAWHSDELDIVKVPPARIREALALEEQFRRTPCALMQYVGFPTTVAPFNDPVVRRAVAMCIDRQGIIDAAFSGTRPLAQRILPPSLRETDEDLIRIDFDPEAARSLLDESGVQPVTTEFAYNAGLGHDQWVSMVIDQINSALGWKVTPRPMAWPQFLKWLPNANTLFRMTWAIDYPSVDNFLFPLFHSASIGDDNFTRYRNVEVDDDIDAARSTPQSQKRRRLYNRAEATVCKDLPLLPLWFGVQYHLVNLRRFEVDGPVVDMFGEPVLRLFKMRSNAGRQ